MQRSFSLRENCSGCRKNPCCNYTFLSGYAILMEKEGRMEHVVWHRQPVFLAGCHHYQHCGGGGDAWSVRHLVRGRGRGGARRGNLRRIYMDAARDFCPAVRSHAAARASAVQSAVVTEPIDNLAETGAVRVLGKEWTARTKDGTPVPAGARVTILEIRGVKAIVQKIETNGEKE